MAEEKKRRDLKREYETSKARGEKILTIKITQKLNDDFTRKCADLGTNRNSVLKDYIIHYTYGDQPDRD